MSSTAVHSAGPGLTFRLACWALGLVAFLQLLVAGIALARRVEAARVVRVEERIKVVTVPAAAPEVVPAEPAGPVVAIPPPPPVPVEAPLPPARPLDAPPIGDPVVERLVNEAREARVAEDMVRAIPKLEEALDRDPKEPNALYEMALAYETMAGFDTSLADKAAACYQKVFELGTTGAGALYPLAARKLRDGIARPIDMRGKLSLGRVAIFPDTQYAAGERVVLTVPVNAAPGSEPAAEDFFVKVEFFDKTPNGEPQPAAPDCETSYEWVSGEIDWVGGQELLRVTYILPEASEPGQEHLFGRRKYYGQVVELIYKNELIDCQPWPRHLAARSRVEPQLGLDPLFMEQDLLPGGSLLPPLEDEMLPDFDER